MQQWARAQAPSTARCARLGAEHWGSLVDQKARALPTELSLGRAWFLLKGREDAEGCRNQSQLSGAPQRACASPLSRCAATFQAQPGRPPPGQPEPLWAVVTGPIQSRPPSRALPPLPVRPAPRVLHFLFQPLGVLSSPLLPSSSLTKASSPRSADPVPQNTLCLYPATAINRRECVSPSGPRGHTCLAHLCPQAARAGHRGASVRTGRTQRGETSV